MLIIASFPDVILGAKTFFYRDYALFGYPLAHYHRERNHQGLDNHVISREGAVGDQTGPVARRERLGGLLSYYYREAA